MNPRAVTSNSLDYYVKTMRHFLKLPSPIEIYLTCKTFRTFDFRTVCLPVRTVLANLRPQNMSKTEAKCENDKRRRRHSIKLEEQGLHRRNNNFEIKIVHLRLFFFFFFYERNTQFSCHLWNEWHLNKAKSKFKSYSVYWFWRYNGIAQDWRTFKFYTLGHFFVRH